MASQRLLFVDDEPDLLAFYRQVFERDFGVTTFTSAQEALAHISRESDYAVIVSDFSMPGMDGIEFLSAAREVAPQAMRIMLTGFATDETAISAVNRGDIFKFLRKPTRIAEFSSAIRAAVQRYQLNTAEHELLEKTLRGSIAMLTDALSLASPRVFGRCSRLKQDMVVLAQRLHLKPSWELEAAAMLCELGLLTQADSVVDRIVHCDPMNPAETEEFHRQAGIGAELVRKVPRLERVADSILFQYKNYDGSGYPEEQVVAGDDLPIGARMLRVLKDLHSAIDRGSMREDALARMRDQPQVYDGSVVAALAADTGTGTPGTPLTLSVFALQPGSVLADDVISHSGSLIMRHGQEISPYLAAKLHHFAEAGEIASDVRVHAPRPPDGSDTPTTNTDHPTQASETHG